MFIDLTLKITPKLTQDAQGNLKQALVGHLGTHFDVMNKEFPLEYIERPGIVFDVSSITDRDIELRDIDIDAIEPRSFVAFYTGMVEREGYGTKRYFTDHSQFSHELIDALLERGVSIIGLDCSGLRNGAEHTPADQKCADHGTFVLENLCNLGALIKAGQRFTAHTYPMNYEGSTGLPCRVVAEL